MGEKGVQGGNQGAATSCSSGGNCRRNNSEGCSDYRNRSAVDRCRGLFRRGSFRGRLSKSRRRQDSDDNTHRLEQRKRHSGGFAWSAFDRLVHRRGYVARGRSPVFFRARSAGGFGDGRSFALAFAAVDRNLWDSRPDYSFCQDGGRSNLLRPETRANMSLAFRCVGPDNPPNIYIGLGQLNRCRL